MRFYKSPPRTDDPAGDEQGTGENNKDANGGEMSNGTSKLDAGLAHIVGNVEGAIGVALVDLDGGLTLASAGGSDDFDLDIASAGGIDVVRAQKRTMDQLGFADEADQIEDILITMGRQYHLIRRLPANPTLFLYLAIQSDRGNLGLARHQLRSVENELGV